MRIVTEGPLLDEMSKDAGTLVVKPTAVCVPESEAEVAEAVSYAIARGLSVTLRGGGTSIPSQAVGSGVTILQSRAAARMLGPSSVVAEPALVKSELNKLTEPSGVWMPIDPSSYLSCTLGGMVANNSSGLRTPKYGSTIDYVASMRVFLQGEGFLAASPIPLQEALAARGWVGKVAALVVENQKDIEAERPSVTKNSSGYRLERVVHDGVFDLPKLFVGSEGTLGVFTEATLRLVKKPGWRVLFIIETGLERLDDVAQEFRSHSPSALELVDKSVFRQTGREDKIARYARSEEQYMVFCEFEGEGSPDLLVEEIASSKVAGFDPLVLTEWSEVSGAWGVRNETLALASEIKREGKVLVPGVEDLVVPPQRLSDLVALLYGEFTRRGLQFISYGHAGDANLHSRPMLDPKSSHDMKVLDEMMAECFEAVWKMNGSITGEHGDGRIRADYVKGQYPKTHWIMKEIRASADPKGLLSPGVKVV